MIAKNVIKPNASTSLRHRFVKALLQNVLHRCTEPTDKRFADYGGKGIHCDLTLDDLYRLYERDRPDLMLRPSIDRKDSERSYEFDNCRFIELYDNIKARRVRQLYHCQQCGTREILRQINGKKLCPACTEVERRQHPKIAKYTRFVIENAESRGMDVRLLIIDRAHLPSSHRILVNDLPISIHYASHHRSSGGRIKYWHFNKPRIDAFAYVFLAKLNKSWLCFVCPKDLIRKQPSGGFYIPVKQETKRIYLRRTRWFDYLDGWQKVFPAKESAVA